MTNQPLSNNDLTKIVVFILLLSPSIFFIIGIVPSIFLAFGIFMTNKSKDFSHIETAVRNYKYYILTCLTGCILLLLYAALFVNHNDEEVIEIIGFGLFCTAISYLYIVLVDKLFLSLLEPHADWVATNGIFSGNNKVIATEIKSDRLNSYSVVEELSKWAKLKEDGHITEQEFDDVRKKLLQKN